MLSTLRLLNKFFFLAERSEDETGKEKKKKNKKKKSRKRSPVVKSASESPEPKKKSKKVYIIRLPFIVRTCTLYPTSAFLQYIIDSNQLSP